MHRRLGCELTTAADAATPHAASCKREPVSGSPYATGNKRVRTSLCSRCLQHVLTVVCPSELVRRWHRVHTLSHRSCGLTAGHSLFLHLADSVDSSGWAAGRVKHEGNEERRRMRTKGWGRKPGSCTVYIRANTAYGTSPSNAAAPAYPPPHGLRTGRAHANNPPHQARSESTRPASAEGCGCSRSPACLSRIEPARPLARRLPQRATRYLRPATSPKVRRAQARYVRDTHCPLAAHLTRALALRSGGYGP